MHNPKNIAFVVIPAIIMFLFTVACSGPDRDVRQDDSGDRKRRCTIADAG